jgi:CRISPR-associated protein Cas5h
MRAISFRLGGKTACFRKPDVNEHAYFTYNNIHKPALLGLLGAIVGYGGYTKLHDSNRGLKKDSLEYSNGYMEYYERLKSLKISITPLAKNGYFSKKIQTFNNSVGYASFEAGGNLVVREQWLENPLWQIMIIDDESEEFAKIEEYLLGKKSVFVPYLGKNDHPATISEVSKIEMSDPDGSFVDSLFIKNFDSLEDSYQKEGELAYLFMEMSPYSLQEEYHFYEYKQMIFTNYELEALPRDTYGYDGKNYSFI